MQRASTGDPGQAANYLRQAGEAVNVQWKPPDGEDSIEIIGLHEVATSELDYLEADSIIVEI